MSNLYDTGTVENDQLIQPIIKTHAPHPSAALQKPFLRQQSLLQYYERVSPTTISTTLSWQRLVNKQSPDPEMKSRGESSVETPGGTIALGSLSPQQLEKLQGDLQREVEMISVRLAQLSNAVQRLSASKENSAQIATMKEGKDLMIPMTSSIYVPGKLQDTSKVLIDIGTGFFVEKSPKAAETHFARRAGLLKEEQDKSTQIHTQKRQQLEAVNAVLQRKTAEVSAGNSKTQS